MRDLPVDSCRNIGIAAVVGRVDRHLGEVKDHVPDLAEELVLVDIPAFATSARHIWVSIDESNAAESIAPDNDRFIERMADELGIVILYDRAADLVTSRLQKLIQRVSFGKATSAQLTGK